MTAWTMSGRQRSVVTVTAALVLVAAMSVCVPAGARASAIRVPASPSSSSSSSSSSSVTVVVRPNEYAPIVRQRRHDDAPTVAADAPAADRTVVVRKKRTLLKLKPLVVLPAKVALGAGAKLVAGAKLGAKAVGLGAKALGVGAVGLKAVKKVAKVTVKAATALGVKAVLLNFLFQKINQVIDFKTRLLSNLDQRNRQQNAQFLSPVLPQSASATKPSSGSVGNKDDDDFLASGTPGDQQVLAQEQSKSSAVAPAVAPLEDEPEVTFDANKVTLQVPDRLFGPSFTAATGISQAIGTVVQNAASRLARLVEAVKAAIWRKAAGLSSLSNSSGGFAGAGGAAGARGSRDAAADLSVVGDDGLDADPLDEVAVAASSAVDTKSSKKRDAAAAAADSDAKVGQDDAAVHKTGNNGTGDN